MKKLSVLLFIIVSFCFASGDYTPNEVDCLVIKEENSIICKYMSERSTEDKFVNVEWINPRGEVSRARKILFPSGHGSIYDFRYLSGRESGVWTFKVLDGDKEFKVEFEVKPE